MAIDWLSRCLFWADGTAATINIIKLDGPVYYQKVLLAGAGNLDVSMRVANPTSLAVDPVNGLATVLVVERGKSRLRSLSTVASELLSMHVATL
jgi:hypothetical protein